MSNTAAATAATAVGGPLLAFAGAWLGVRANRRASVELDRWRRREETMRLLRWAAEMACGHNVRAAIGVASLDALQRSELVQDEDAELVNVVMSAVVRDEFDAYDQDAEPECARGRP